VGIGFSDESLDDDQADEPTGGFAEPFTIKLGLDCECASLIVFTFEEDEDEPGGIRVDFTVTLADDVPEDEDTSDDDE
jgi:hypothetical protein